MISDMDSKPRWLGKRSRVRLGQHSGENIWKKGGGRRTKAADEVRGDGGMYSRCHCGTLVLTNTHPTPHTHFYWCFNIVCTQKCNAKDCPRHQSGSYLTLVRSL